MAAAPAVTAIAAPARYDLREGMVTLAPGPHRDVAVSDCTGCHSADHFETLPRGLRNPVAVWSATVAKACKVYGAPIEDTSVKPPVDYLAAACGE
jgi:hypothetical protein